MDKNRKRRKKSLSWWIDDQAEGLIAGAVGMFIVIVLAGLVNVYL